MCKRIVAPFVLCFICLLAYGQNPNIGHPPFSSFQNFGPDSINLSNLNMRLSIPIVSKKGIGLSFNAGIVLNGGVQANNGMNWQWPAGSPVGVVPSIGLGAPTADVTSALQCNGGYNSYSIDGIVADDGTFHAITPTFVCDTPVTATTTDGSALQITFSETTDKKLTVATTYPSGVVATSVGIPRIQLPPVSFTSALADTNGNHINGCNYNCSWADTLGISELSIALTNGGLLPYSMNYTYPTASGSATVSANYSAHNGKTNYGCSLIADWNSGPFTLLDSISLPDGSSYSFTYEPTPNNTGYTTGRLKQITLPTGGTITYAYTGPNNGINCNDGTPAGLTRTTSDGTWTYTRNTSTWLQTTEVSPAPDSNKTVYTFSQRTTDPKNFFETERQINQGASTLLADIVTCYNGNGTQATCPTYAAPNLPLTQTDVYTKLSPMSSSARVSTLFDSYENVTQSKAYDFGAASPTSWRYILYGTVSGSQCVAIGSGINDRVCAIQDLSSDGSTIINDVNFAYDSHGNLLTKTMWPNWPSATPTLTQTATYNTNGMVNTVTGVNGAQTTYAYNGSGGCNNGFPTSITAPLNLTSVFTWDCNGAVMLTAKDPNNQTTTTSYVGDGADPFFRPETITDPTGAVTVFDYAVQSMASELLFNGGTSHSETGVGLDGLGRQVMTDHQTAPGSTAFDTFAVSYDSNGRLSKIYMPCTTNGWTCPTPYTSQTYDALGRPLVTTDGGSPTPGTITYSYSGRDVTVTLGPATDGTVKKVQKEYDGMGRLKSSCAISSASGSGSCSQDSGGTGFLTTYGYNALGQLSQITKNAQSGTTQNRAFTYDAFGRVLTEKYPEQGNVATTYVYDTYPAYCGSGNAAPALVQSTDASGHITCYYYDALHRIVSEGNGNFSNNTTRIFVYDSATVNGQTMQNPKGRLVEAYTENYPNTNKITDIGFSYNARGELADMYESTPHSGGYYHTTAAYWANGALSSLSGVPGQSAWTYGVDGEGRPYTAVQGSTNFVTNTTFNSGSQPLVVSLGLGDSANYGYDPNTGRLSNYTFTVGSTPKSQVGTLTWNPNGTLKTLAITDGFNAGGAHTCNYKYDELARLGQFNTATPVTNVDCGASVWQQAFQFDPFDNLTKTVPPGGSGVQWMPGYNQATNRYNLGGTTYDANGNLTNDSFHTYTWDADWKLPLTVDSTSVIFDALGRMVEKGVSGTNTEILYSPIGKTAQMNGQTLIQAYIPLPGGQTLFETPSVQNFWFSDWLETVRLGSDRAGRNVTCTTCFDRAFAPYGESYKNFGSTANLDFTGDTQDTVPGELGLFDTPNRELHSHQGRWISPDPAHSGWNAYAYVMDPMTGSDPSGLGDDCAAEGGCDNPDRVGAIGIVCYPSCSGGDIPSGGDITLVPSGSDFGGLGGLSESMGQADTFASDVMSVIANGMTSINHFLNPSGAPSGLDMLRSLTGSLTGHPGAPMLPDIPCAIGCAWKPSGMSDEGRWDLLGRINNWAKQPNRYGNNGHIWGNHFRKELVELATGKGPAKLQGPAERTLARFATHGGPSIQNAILDRQGLVDYFNEIAAGERTPLARFPEGGSLERFAIDSGARETYTERGLYWDMRNLPKAPRY